MNYKPRLQLSINSFRKFKPNYIGVNRSYVGNYERSVIWTFEFIKQVIVWNNDKITNSVTYLVFKPLSLALEVTLLALTITYLLFCWPKKQMQGVFLYFLINLCYNKPKWVVNY